MGAVHRKIFLLCLCLWSVLVLVGCPGFEDSYSGTYQEVVEDSERSELVAVDFFRFGGDARALIRYYKRTPSSSADTVFTERNQTRCVWAKADRFDEVGLRFQLPILPSAQQGRAVVNGRVDRDGGMQIRIEEEGRPEEARDIKLVQVREKPDPTCDMIDDFFVRAVFDELPSNTLPAERHRLSHPVLAIMWVGVEPVRRDDVVIYVAFNRPEPAVRLDEGRNFSGPGNGLLGSLPLLISAPDERMLVRSGETRYALAHFVVIDDRAREGRFTWEISEEPIVGTALQSGRLEGIPDGIQSNGWGKAVLFVEGKLSQLDQQLQMRLDGIEESDDNAHFYIVEVFYYNDEVMLVRLPERPQPNKPVPRSVSVQLTEEHLDRREVLLPRLFPYSY